MTRRPEDDRAARPPTERVIAQPAPRPTSLLLVGSLLKPEGEQELVRVKATVDAPLDATCIRRVRKLLEALSRTMLSRDRSRWERIDQAREVLELDDREQEAPTERTDGAEAQTERRIRVPSDGAPAGVGLRAGRGEPATGQSEATDRAEAPTRRVRIAGDPLAVEAASQSRRPSPSPASPPPPPSATPALAPPRPKPSPWATTTSAAMSPPARPPLPYPVRDRSIPMVLGSEAARLAGGPQHASLLGAPPSQPLQPAGAARTAPPIPMGVQTERGQQGGSSPQPATSLDDEPAFTVAFEGPRQLADPLPFRAEAPAGGDSPTNPEAPAASAPGAADRGGASDDGDLPTITTDGLPRQNAPPSGRGSTSQDRQSEPIEQTLARLARAAGEAIMPMPASRYAAPPKLVDDGATVAAPGPSTDDELEPLPESLAAITVEGYAELCAQSALRPHERLEAHHRFQIADEPQRAALDRHWRTLLDRDETLARQWRWHYARHEQRLRNPT